MLKAKALVVGAIVGVLAAGGVAYATIPGPDGVIHGCYTKSGGALRVIDGGVTKCKSTETSLDWSQHGSPGPAGPTGPAGTTGPAGPTGPQGPSGDVWLVKAAAVVLAANPDEGNAQHVNSVVVPAGTFFLTSTINGYNTIGTARPQCQFVSSDAAIIFGLAAAQTVPPAEEESFTAQALATVDTGPATVSLECQNLGDSSVGVSADVIAQQVGTIH